MKTCPFCAEEIQDAAIVCKHCGRELEPDRVIEVHQSTVADVPEPELTLPQADQPEPLKPKRYISLLIGSVLIGISCAALSAAPRILDVVEAIELAANNPSAIPLMRMLERDLAGHFITSLFIFSIIGGLVIWGWRRTRAFTLKGLVVVWMLIGIVGVIKSVSVGPAGAKESEIRAEKFAEPWEDVISLILAPAPTPKYTEMATSIPLAPIVNYSCSCPQLSANALNSAPQGSTACFSGLWTGGGCGVKTAPWNVIVSGAECGMVFEGVTRLNIGGSEQDCPGCYGSSVAESQGSIRQDTYIDVTGWVTGWELDITGQRLDNGLFVTSVQACSIVP